MVIDREHELLLEKWGRWMRRSRDNIGYPRRSVEGRLKDDGGWLPHGTSSMVPEAMYMPAEVEMVEKAVLTIQKLTRGTQYVNVIKQEYIYSYSSQRANADKQKMTLRRYKECLERAREMVALQIHQMVA